MQDFDTARDERLKRDRTFKIGGLLFTYKAAVPPEALVRWADMNADTPESEAIEIMDHTVLALLEMGQEEKWKAVRDVNAENPISANDILGVIQWMVEEQTGRPTTPPSGSTSGSGNGGLGTTLTAVPVSLAEPASPASV